MHVFEKLEFSWRNHLRWGAVAAVFANPLGIIDFCTVEDGDVVVTAVVVSFHIKLLKLHFNDLQQETSRRENLLSSSQTL